MGNVLLASDGALEQEKSAWARDHSLVVSYEFKSRFLPPLHEHFCTGTMAKLQYREESFMPSVKYKHFYITCGTWTIEFGGGSLLDNKVEVHNRSLPLGGIIEKTFVIDARHIQRMENVVGATGYSICLRNCEHVARYICYGSWQSLQMLEDHPLLEKVATHMQGHTKVKINVPPSELVDRQVVVQPLHPDEEGFIEVTNSCKFGFTPDDRNAYNVVLIGPTGSGKSSLSNQLCNRTVCEYGASALSVTRQISVVEGRAVIRGRQQKVNIVDTIGLCDSTMCWQEAVTLTKQWLKVQSTVIDRFVIVVDGRIEAVHAQCIRELLKWLRFPMYPYNFVFVYNKADLIEDSDTVDSNVQIMREMLNTHCQGKSTSHLNFSLGIPRGASFMDTKKRLEPFLAAVFPASERQDYERVLVNDSQCFLL